MSHARGLVERLSAHVGDLRPRRRHHQLASAIFERVSPAFTTTTLKCVRCTSPSHRHDQSHRHHRQIFDERSPSESPWLPSSLDVVLKGDVELRVRCQPRKGKTKSSVPPPLSVLAPGTAAGSCRHGALSSAQAVVGGRAVEQLGNNHRRLDRRPTRLTRHRMGRNGFPETYRDGVGNPAQREGLRACGACRNLMGNKAENPFHRAIYLTGPTASGKTAVGVALAAGWGPRSSRSIR